MRTDACTPATRSEQRSQGREPTMVDVGEGVVGRVERSTVNVSSRASASYKCLLY